MISALWHGVTLNFLIWALLHASFYLVEDVIFRLNKIARLGMNAIVNFIQRLVFFVLISFSWLIFRTVNLDQLWLTLDKILWINNWRLSDLYVFFDNVYFVFIILVLVVLSVNANRLARQIYAMSGRSILERSCELVYVTVCLLLLFVFGDLGVREFLYFKF
jgi:hypothetical protein